jgi:hypothetical protein
VPSLSVKSRAVRSAGTGGPLIKAAAVPPVIREQNGACSVAGLNWSKYAMCVDRFGDTSEILRAFQHR